MWLGSGGQVGLVGQFDWCSGSPGGRMTGWSSSQGCFLVNLHSEVERALRKLLSIRLPAFVHKMGFSSTNEGGVLVEQREQGLLIG